MRLGELSAAVGTTHSHQSHIQPSCLDQNSNSNILWEPCSPLTSVVTEDGRSVVATPKGQQSNLPNVEAEAPNNEESEITSMPIPQQWRVSNAPSNLTDGLNNPLFLQKPSITLNKENFISIVDQALDYTLKIGSVIPPNQRAVLSATISIYDFLTHRRNRTESATAVSPPDQSPDILWSFSKAMEMIHRNRATNEPLLLHRCKEDWNKLIATEAGYYQSSEIGFVCPEQAAESSTVWKTFDRQPQGSNHLTMSGAFCSKTWWESSRHSYCEVFSSVNTILFMTMSGYLAEYTGDPTIKSEAIRSAKCIRKHMLDSMTLLAKVCYFDVENSRDKGYTSMSCYLTGIAIEGFTVLADVTGSDDWRKLAISMAENAMTSSLWHGPDGILSVGSEGKLYINDGLNAMKGLLARGLLALYQRNPTNKPLRNTIRKYINVQHLRLKFNALVDLASRGNSYGVDWRGPFVGPYAHGQLAALELLVAAFGVNFT
ncbi:hypothetical protein FRC02_011345 [Tulasnella sp. 418]|nr:hypothetical protein FRC02_011345 [Tulasnella sp. 418]